MSLSTLACVLSEDGKLWMAEGRSELELHLKVDREEGKGKTLRSSELTNGPPERALLIWTLATSTNSF